MTSKTPSNPPSESTLNTEIDKLLFSFKLHNKDLDVCFNDAVAVNYLKSEIIKLINGANTMTGQEFYQRFEREYHMIADWIAAEELMGDDAEHDVLLAAKRAAGIEE